MDEEKFDLELFPTSESAQRMLSYVTANFYDSSYVGKWIYQVMGLEYDEARRLVEELPDQFFPETATWGLKYHEIKWGLPVRENLSYEERRALIYEKRDFRAPMTPYRMETYINNVTDFQVYVADVHDPGEFGYVPPHPNVFRIYCIGEGTLDTKSVRKVVDRAKQSHTMYIITELIRWELDHRGLESLRLADVEVHTDLPFWHCRILNGSAHLDGSEYLDAQRRYDLRLGISYSPWAFFHEERLRMGETIISAALPLFEDMRSRVDIYTGGMNFWDTWYLDGSSLLDGSMLLNAKRRYGLRLGVQNRVLLQFREGIRIPGISAGYEIQEKTGMKVATEHPGGDLDFWQTDYLDGSALLDGSIPLNRSIYNMELSVAVNANFEHEEALAAGELITIRNLAYFDGGDKLDGSRLLNSIYKKEVI